MTRYPGAPERGSRCQLELPGIWNESSGIEAGGSDPGNQCLELRRLIDLRGPVCDLIRFSHPLDKQNVKTGGLLLELRELLPARLHPDLTNKRPSLVDLVIDGRARGR